MDWVVDQSGYYSYQKATKCIENSIRYTLSQYIIDKKKITRQNRQNQTVFSIPIFLMQIYHHFFLQVAGTAAINK